MSNGSKLSNRPHHHFGITSNAEYKEKLLPHSTAISVCIHIPELIHIFKNETHWRDMSAPWALFTRNIDFMLSGIFFFLKNAIFKGSVLKGLVYRSARFPHNYADSV